MYLDEDIRDHYTPLELTDKEVFIGLWTAPKTVFRFINESCYDKYGYLLEAAPALWTFVLFVIGVAEVQKFTYGKAVLNILLPVLVIAVPLVAFILLLQS